MNNASFFYVLGGSVVYPHIILPVTIKKYLHSESVAVLLIVIKSF